jgi:hypothetical protein
MNAGELLDQLERAGASIEFVDGKARLRGSKVPEELKEALKSQREAVLAEVERRRQEDRDRWGKVPPADAALLANGGTPAEWRKLAMRHIAMQPRPVHAWVMSRANQYFEMGAHQDECEWRACVDAIAWQRNTGARESLKFLADLPTDGGLTKNPKENEELAIPQTVAVAANDG